MLDMTGIRPVLQSGVAKYLLIVCAVVGAVTLYLLATASANTALFAQHYPVLLALNGGLAVCLALLLAYQLYTLRQKLKAGVFGAKLTLRLVLLSNSAGIVSPSAVAVETSGVTSARRAGTLSGICAIGVATEIPIPLTW